MNEKNTWELLRLIRRHQTKLALDLSNRLTNEETDKLYDEIMEAEEIIVSRARGWETRNIE